MSAILVSSILIRLIAFGMSIRLLRHLRDWRMGVLSAMLALMAMRQVLTLLKTPTLWPISLAANFDEFPGLIVSVLAFLSVFFLERMIRDEIDQRAKLQDSEERLKTIVNIAPVAIISTDGNLNIELFNSGAERVFSYCAEEVIGHPVDMLLPERFNEEHRKHIADFARSPESQRLMDQRQILSGLRKDGSEFPAAASVSKIEIAGERIFTVILHDITHRLRAEEERQLALVNAEQANQSKTEFLANMSHELHTPLNAIIGFSVLIKEAMLGPLEKQYRDYANDINNSGEHLLDLLSDILDISKVETGTLEVEEEDVNLVETAAACETMLRGRAGDASVTMIFEVSPDLPQLYADPLRLKQILLNLIENAIKFTAAGGRVTVTGALNGNDEVIFEIADTGIGIHEDDLPGVMEKFGQARDGHMQTHEGPGLGLALVKALVELHEGTLMIESEVEKGTTVIIKFPSYRTKYPPDGWAAEA